MIKQGEINRLFRISRNYFSSIIGSTLFEIRYGSGTKIMQRDWDNLYILDACRYDFFKSETDLDGKLGKVTSRGRDSYEFLDENDLLDGEFHDTVYVTANPHVRYIDEGVFHAIIDDPLRSNFDKELGTVHPKFVTEAALRAHNKYPNKRLIVHYMQPHMPPVGEIRNQMGKLTDGFDMTGKMSEENRFYNLVSQGKIDKEDAITAYRENLQVVLGEVDKLSRIDGKSVITADHGELLGENPSPLMGRTWSHGLTRSHFPKSKQLCIVPWFTLQNSTPRRDTTSEQPTHTDRLQADKAEEYLEALGYI